ncbi:MAG: DUF3592 domain-containing protein [Planctomycetota bacterium]
MFGSDPATRRKRALLAFAGAMLLVTAFNAARIVPAYRLQQRAAEVYQPVSATLLEVEERHYRTKNGPRTEVILTYAYEVEGKRYTSRRFSHFGEAPDKLGYAKGKQYKAYYDPADPSQAVMSRKRPNFGKLALIAGLPLLIAGMVGAIGWASARAEAQRAAQG